MLVGLCGPACTGKRTVATYLIRERGFLPLDRPADLVPSAHRALDDDDDGDDNNNDDETCHLQQLVSQCWKPDVNAVIRNVRPHDPAIPDLLKRPYFLLVYVDAPFLLRFRRAVLLERFQASEMADFAAADDRLRYGGGDVEKAQKMDGNVAMSAKDHMEHAFRFSLSSLEQAARLRLVNNLDSLSSFANRLRSVAFTDSKRLRPTWDTYFMSLARLAAERTNCMKRRVGCVIVRDNRVVATGYNGTPSGVQNCLSGGCPRCNGTQHAQGAGLDLCLCLHAEENAIIEAGRERCAGGSLYTNLYPCILCAKKIVQAGIRRVVFDKHYATDAAAASMFRAGDVCVHAFLPVETALWLSDDKRGQG